MVFTLATDIRWNEMRQWYEAAVGDIRGMAGDEVVVDPAEGPSATGTTFRARGPRGGELYISRWDVVPQQRDRFDRLVRDANPWP